MKLLEKLAKKYCQSVDDDCLCQRTQPGTKFGEHIYCFCGCGISKAYEAGFEKARQMATKLADESPLHCQCAIKIEDMGE